MLTDFVCRVCLCTNKLLRELDVEVAAHFEKLCDYNSDVSTLLCCSVCEESLKYNLYFKNKCWKANKLLQRWLKCNSQERKPLESLHQQLDAWTEANENITEKYGITKTDMEYEEMNQEVMDNVTDSDINKVIFSDELISDKSDVFKLKNVNINSFNDSQTQDIKNIKSEQEDTQITYIDYEVVDECDVNFDQETETKEFVENQLKGTQASDQGEILLGSNADPGYSNFESKFNLHLIEAKQDVCVELTTHDYLSAHHRCETCYAVFRNAKLLQNHIKKWHILLSNKKKSLHELLDKMTETNTEQEHFEVKYDKYTLDENNKKYYDESGNYIIIKTDLEHDKMNQDFDAIITDTDVTESDIYKVISPSKSDVKNVLINNHSQSGDNDEKYKGENIYSEITYTDYEVLLSEDSDEDSKEEDIDLESCTDYKVLHEHNDYFYPTGKKQDLVNKELNKYKPTLSTTESNQGEMPRKHNPGPDYLKYECMFNMHLFKTKQDIQDEFLRRRFSDPYLSARHRCEICYTVYPSEKLLQYHMKRHDPGAGDFECDICRMRFGISPTLSRHMNNAHRGIFTCKACPFSSYCSSAMVKHKHLVERPAESDVTSSIRCEPCGLTFANRPVYNLHLMRTDAHKHIAALFIACSICGENFNNKEQMENHKRTAHAPVTRQRRIKSTPVNCPVCGVTGPNTPWLIFHFRRSHPTEVYSPPPGKERKHLCEQCGRSFVNATLLIEHGRLHSGVRPFQCDYCKNRFRTKDLLRSHMVWHLPPTLRCRQCGKMYHKYNGLMSHVRVHNNDRCFKCLTCGAGFFSGSQMREHERGVHRRERRTRRDKHTLRAREPTSEPSGKHATTSQGTDK